MRSADLHKKILDLLLASVALLLLSPLLIALGILIRVSIGSPVLFRQKRPGLDERPFTLYKFRTMTDEKDDEGRVRPDGERLTGLGRFLRTTSLDELPELFNVLKGDLSLVGPRPLLTRYLPYYSEKERLRHSVRPGITGWAQIHGRNYLPWDERLALDVWYAKNRSLALDLRILFLTLWKVFRREGASADPDEAETYLDEERSSEGSFSRSSSAKTGK